MSGTSSASAPRGEKQPRPAARLRLVLGDQLNVSHSWFGSTRHDTLYLLMEVRTETDYVTHHIQKLLSVFGAMRRFAAALTEAGHRVFYLAIDDERNVQTIPGNLAWIVKEMGAATVEMQLCDDYRLRHILEPRSLEKALAGPARSGGVAVSLVDTEHFLVAPDEFDHYLPPEKNPVMEYFYRRVRGANGWLVDAEGRPEGGSWNLDAENRGAWRGPDRDPEPPEPWHAHNDLTAERAAVEASGCAHFGEADPADAPWPLTRKQALAAVDHFVQRALPHFGTYQDALHTEQETLFHSRLSFALNVKLISPREVIDAVIEAYRAGDDISLNQVEGFVRQVAGWREYMRILYWRLMPELTEANTLDAHLPLPSWYWTGQTKMACLAAAIGQSLRTAYAHHIQRLMVTGNFALIAGIDPVQVDAWYLGIYIDAFDWVERPNSRGMSQYADGGVIATKPYASTAAYIKKQGDYCAQCPYNPATRTDDDSCPFNALYWDFYARNDQLRSNRRIRFVYPTWEKLDPGEQTAIRRRATWLREDMESL